MKDEKQAKSIQISKKVMMVSIMMVSIVLIGSVILTLILQPGIIENVSDGSIRLLPGENHMTVWKYVLSPLLVLTPMYENCMTVWSIVLLCIVIGAVFNSLDASGVLVYMVETLARKFGDSKYRLLFVLSLVMMFLGTTLGIAEEVIPLVPLAVMLFYALGWDSPLAVMASATSPPAQASPSASSTLLTPDFPSLCPESLSCIPAFCTGSYFLPHFMVRYGSGSDATRSGLTLIHSAAAHFRMIRSGRQLSVSTSVP